MYNEEILQEIIQVCRGKAEEVSKEDLEELQAQLKILKDATSEKEEGFLNEQSEAYWKAAGLGTSHWLHGKGVYQEVLHAITKILDILRGAPLTITIQKTERNSRGEIIGITTYRGKESDLSLVYNGKEQQVEYDLEQSLSALEKIETASEAYVKHYSDFYTIANAHIKSGRSSSAKKGWRKKVNEGNIVEAFQRHLENRHRALLKEEDTYSDTFTVPEVIILLYYSVGNVPWWQQGDIGYNQIKNANNVKLASAASIRRVSEKILSLFNDKNSLENFENTFKKMFTAQDLEQITDTEKMSKEEQRELLKYIKENTKQFKDIPLKI